ncbi:MAG TPA: hypothetical protein IAB39_07540 [Candidatus Onthovicinus excrementipullorum]|nr:hypothetical protein [Candidatus Onthovicinus excrementipullorum]
MKRWISLLIAGVMTASLVACNSYSPAPGQEAISSVNPSAIEAPEGFLLIPGGTFTMGSPGSEAWRSE